MYYAIYYSPSRSKLSLENEWDDSVEIIPRINGRDGCWRWGKEKFRSEKDNLCCKKQKDGFVVYVKTRLLNPDGDIRGEKPKTLWDDKTYSTTNGTNTIKSIFGEKKFDSPKSVNLIKDIMQISTKKTSTVLDFFAGSGTTGQAVLELNKEDGGHRQFILCTNNENNIARDITYPRIKTVITGKRQDGSSYSEGLPANLRYFVTDYVEKQETRDGTRAKLFWAVEDMIRVKENAFSLSERTDKYILYKGMNKYALIVIDPFGLRNVWKKVEENDSEKMPIDVYVFSYTNYTFEDEIPETNIEYKICSIPTDVMEVYRKCVERKEPE